MTETASRSGLSVIFAFLGGAVIGGAVYALFAPKTGTELRHRLGDAASSSRDVATRMPKAIREASNAAQVAFRSAMREGGDAIQS